MDIKGILSYETIVIVMYIIQLILTLMILICVSMISLRIKGRIGSKTMLIAFSILAFASISRALTELGILKLDGYLFLIEKIAFIIFLILMIIYFCGIHSEINNIASNHLRKKRKR